MSESRHLLAEYARGGSEPAFCELVNRYVDLVFSTAVRLLDGDTHGAEDVAQTVFADLARMAGTLSPDVMLGGWLHRHTCFVAAKTRRGEWRREAREREAAQMNSAQDETDFSRVAPILDEAINQLGAEDRTAILLRFFEQHDFRRIGQALGSNEDAARMRVSRALDKLGEMLKRRGLTTSAGALTVALSANAVGPAPVGLAVSITTAAAVAASAATAALASHTTLTAMNWINAKAITLMLAAALATGAGTYVLQQRQAARLQDANEKLAAQQDALVQERDQAAAAAAGNAEELERLRRDQGELVRLRGEVAGLREQAKDLQRLKNQNQQLQAALKQSPPSNAAAEPDPATDPQRQLVYAKMSDAKVLMLGAIMYAMDNQKQFPADLTQITNYPSHGLQQLTGTNQFELVFRGSLTELTNPGVVATTIAVREAKASFVNGKWFKAYGFADGHAEYKPEPPEGFDAWEKQHIVVSQQ